MDTLNKDHKIEHFNPHSEHAYQILHLAFTLVPVLAGLDKFFNLLTHWEQYLSSPFLSHCRDACFSHSSRETVGK